MRHYIRLTPFLLSISPTTMAILIALGVSVPHDYIAFSVKLLFWLLAATCPLIIFLIYNEPGLARLQFSKFRYYIFSLWCLYPFIILAAVLYKMSFQPNTILYTLLWIIPLQAIIIVTTWSVIRKEAWLFTVEDEEEKIRAIPTDIFLDQEKFTTYCKEMLRQGNAFQILLSARKGIASPFLKSKEIELILLEGQWRENERNYNKIKINSETYQTTKTRLIGALKETLSIY